MSRPTVEEERVGEKGESMLGGYRHEPAQRAVDEPHRDGVGDAGVP
jgi:hypothetical protein